jgi:single-stranded DNA-binding protein
MTEASVSFAGNLTDDPEVRSTDSGIARAMFRVVVVGRLQQRTWTAGDSSARSTVEVLAEELGPSLRWATATTTRTTRSQSQ